MDGVVALDAEAVPELTGLAAFALSTVMSFLGISNERFEGALARSLPPLRRTDEDEEPKSENSKGAKSKINSSTLRAWGTQSLTSDDTNDYDRYDQCDADPHVLHATLY